MSAPTRAAGDSGEISQDAARAMRDALVACEEAIRTFDNGRPAWHALRLAEEAARAALAKATTP